MRLGIPVLPPDINRSGADFRVEAAPDGKPAIRFALAAVKRVGEGAMKDLVKARGGQPFVSLADFAGRVDPRLLNKMQLENLARAGALSGWTATVRGDGGPPRSSAPRAVLAEERNPARSGCSGRMRSAPNRCGCPTRRIGRCSTSWRRRPRRSASISRRTRWTPTGAPCNGWG